MCRAEVDGRRTGAIERGLVVLAAFAPQDTETELAWMAAKLTRLRLFDDADGKLNLSLQQTGGGILLISQFTLYGDCCKGNRPSYVGSAPPQAAAALYRRFGELLRRQWPEVAEGRFGASMQVSLTNEGPVTVILDRDAPPLAGGES